MKICGIELKANNIIFSIVEFQDDEATYIDTKIKKLSLIDDEIQTSIIDFKVQIEDFILANDITKIIIKKRAKKGNFAGGVLTFKIETIIQLNIHCKVEFVSSQAINKYIKNNDVIFPDKLNKYQEQAYLSTLTYID
jgi:hypothetical protein